MRVGCLVITVFAIFYFGAVIHAIMAGYGDCIGAGGFWTFFWSGVLAISGPIGIVAAMDSAANVWGWSWFASIMAFGLPGLVLAIMVNLLKQE